MTAVAVVREGDVLLRIVYDQSPENPRDWDNAGKMICWHSRSTIGDEHWFSDPESFLRDLVLFHNESALRERAEEEIRIEEIEQAGEKTWRVYDRRAATYYEEYETEQEAQEEREAMIEMFLDDPALPTSDLFVMLPEDFTILPVYMYDHGGVTLNTEGFSCPWDSGQVGWIYMLPDKAAELVKAGIDPLETLRAEVKTFGEYMNGDVYGFQLVRLATCPACGHTGEREIDTCYGFFGSDHKSNGMKEALPKEYRHLLDKV